MKTLIITLVIVSFLQSSILPLDLVLIILICRSYLRADRNNLFLAFGFGLLDGHLNLTPLGLNSLIYLTVVQVTQSLSKSRLAGNLLLIMPISFVLLFLTQRSVPISLIFLESLMSLPTLYLLKFWEERFIVRKEIKLRV